MRVNRSQHLDFVAQLGDPRSPDEDRPERRVEANDVEVLFEGLVLASEGVAMDDGVEDPEKRAARPR